MVATPLKAIDRSLAMIETVELYVKLSPERNEAVFFGIEFADFIKCTLIPIENILLLRSSYTSDKQCHNFELLEGETEISKLPIEDIYNYGDFCFVDYANTASINQLTKEQVAELLYLANLSEPLSSPFFDVLQNNYVYLSHDDGWYCKLYCKERQALTSILPNKLLKSLQNSLCNKMSSLPDGLSEKISELSTHGLFIQLDIANKKNKTATIKLYNAGEYENENILFDNIEHVKSKISFEMQIQPPSDAKNEAIHIYAKITPERNEAVFAGIELADLLDCLPVPIENILLPQPVHVGDKYFQSFELLEGEGEIVKLKSLLTYSRGKVCFVDYVNTASVNQLTKEQVAELLYLSHMYEPLNTPFLDTLQSNYAYLSHDDGRHCKLYCKEWHALTTILLNKLLKCILEICSCKVYSLPDSLTEKITELSVRGLLIQLDVKKQKNESLQSNDFITVKLFEVGTYQNMDDLFNNLACIKSQLSHEVQLTYDPDTGT